MSKSALSFSFILLLIFSSVNCYAEDEVSFPLTIGSSWQYSVTIASGGFQYNTREEIIGTEIINGVTAYQKAYYDSGFQNGTAIDDYSLFSFDESYIYFLGENQVGNPHWNEDLLGLKLLSSPYPKIPTNLLNYAGKKKLSAKFILPDGSEDPVWVETEYLGTENVTVPAGSFSDCHKFQETFESGSTEVSWYCSEVGLTKKVEYIDGQLDDVKELVSYNIMGDEPEIEKPEIGEPEISAITERNFRFETVWPAKQQQWNFDQLTSVAVNNNGTIFLADYYHNRIQVFNRNGRLINSLGVFGTKRGELNRPFALAIGVNQQLYVTDLLNNRVQVFDENGQFIRQWGGIGQNPGQFYRPTGIATDKQGRVYVVDMGNYRIQVFSPEGEFITQWGSKGSGTGQFGGNSEWNGLFDLEINGPMAITVSDQGRVYVTDTWNKRIQIFSVDGGYISQFVSDGNDNIPSILVNSQVNKYPTGVSIDQNQNLHVYIGNESYGHIEVFSNDGEYVRFWGKGTHSPSGLFNNGNNEVFVVDNSVGIYSVEGSLIRHWTNKGSEKGEFSGASSVAVDDLGQVYVADQQNKRIQVFDKNGQYLHNLEAPNNVSKEFGEINDIHFDPVTQRIYVADTSTSSSDSFNIYTATIRAYNTRGQFIRELPAVSNNKSSFYHVTNIATDQDGNYYLSETYTGNVYVFSKNGDFLRQWPYHKSSFVSAMVIKDDTVYIAAGYKYKISAYSLTGQYLFEWGSLGGGNSSFTGFGPLDLAIDLDGNIIKMKTAGTDMNTCATGTWAELSDSSMLLYSRTDMDAVPADVEPMFLLERVQLTGVDVRTVTIGFSAASTMDSSIFKSSKMQVHLRNHDITP